MKNDLACHKIKPGSRRIHRLMDEVYREMYQLEAGRPGAEMGLALALLRARAAADLAPERHTDWDWLKNVLPIGLKMIENSLDRGGSGVFHPQRFSLHTPRC